MTRSVLAGSFCLCALASGALAADVSITGNVSQTIDGSNNYFLTPTPSGITVRSLSALNLDFLARMPTTVYDLKTNYSYYHYFGPGAADAGGLTSGAPAGAAFSIDHTADPLTKYNFAASWQRADITAAQLLQSGTATVRGSSDTYNMSGGFSRQLSRADSISWTAQASTVSFSAPNQTPYLDVTTTGTWNHSLSETTLLVNTVALDYNAQDDPSKDQRLFWTITTGLQSQLSKRLTVNGAIGMNFINAWQNGGVSSPVPPVVPPAFSPTGFVPLQAGAGHGWLGNIGLTYQLLKTTQVSLTAAQSTTPTVFGSLQQSQTIGFNLAHNINSLSNLTFSTQFAVNTQSGNSSNLLAGSASSASDGSTSDLFTASASYGYRLTRELRTNLSYTYTQVSGITGTSGLIKSNTVLVSLTRDFTVLP